MTKMWSPAISKVCWRLRRCKINCDILCDGVRPETLATKASVLTRRSQHVSFRTLPLVLTQPAIVILNRMPCYVQYSEKLVLEIYDGKMTEVCLYKR